MGSIYRVSNQLMKTMMKRAISKKLIRPEIVQTPPVGAATGRSRADQMAAEHLMSLLKAGADTRTAKVKRIRQSVRSRSYENELKLSVAMDRLTGDLAG